MSEIIKRAEDALALPLAGSGLSRREQRDLGRAIDKVAARGVVRAAEAQADAYVAFTRVEAAGFVAQTGLNRVAALSAEEARLIAQAPLGDARYRAIVDTVAGVVAHEVAKLGYER